MTVVRCKQCGETFNGPARLATHMRSHHGEGTPPPAAGWCAVRMRAPARPLTPPEPRTPERDVGETESASGGFEACPPPVGKSSSVDVALAHLQSARVVTAGELARIDAAIAALDGSAE